MKIYEKENCKKPVSQSLDNQENKEKPDHDKICHEVEEKLKTHPEELYSKYSRINQTACIEIIAKQILKNISCLEEIQPIERKKSYKTASHKQISESDRQELYADKKRRREEWIAKSLFEKLFNSVGTIIDYQTPLKNERTDKAGKIDLLSYDKKNKKLSLLELKIEKSPESILRCALEIYTYYKQIKQKKLLNDFNCPADTNIEPAILVYKNGIQYQQYANQNAHYLIDLMHKLGIAIYVYDSEFNITKPNE